MLDFLKNSGIFFFGNVLSKVIVFFMLPIYTNYIPPADYGLYDLSMTYIIILTAVLYFDIWQSVQRFIFDFDEDSLKYRVIYSGWQIFGVCTIVYFLLGVIGYTFISLKYYWLIFAYGLALCIQHMYTSAIRGFQKNTLYAISGVVNTLTTVVLNILFIVFLGLDYSSLYIASICGSVSQILILERELKVFKGFSLKRNKEQKSQMLKYALPLCLNSVSYWLLTSFNRIVISQRMSYDDNGIYAIGNKFGSIIYLVTTCFTLAWQDMSFSHGYGKKDDSGFYSKACSLYTKFNYLGFSLVLPVFYIVFPFLVNEAYDAARQTIPLFLLVTILSTYSTFMSNIFYAIKDTRPAFTSMAVSVVLNFALCYPLIDWWGLNGANLSILISFFLNIVIRYWILKRKINLRLDIKQSLLAFVLIGASMAVYQLGGLSGNLIWFFMVAAVAIFLLKDELMKIITSLKGKPSPDEMSPN